MIVNCEVLKESINEIKNEITTIYGEAATGKTTLAKILAIEAAKNGKVIFIDTENGFSVERIRQLSGEEYDNVINKIFVMKIKGLEEQERKIRNLLELKDTKLVIIDTIGRYYRLEAKKDVNNANILMHRQFNVLSELNSKEIPVLITNQVYTNIEDGKINIVGGNMIKNWSKCLMKLEKNPRKLVLEKPCFKEIEFEIKENGIFLKEGKNECD